LDCAWKNVARVGDSTVFYTLACIWHYSADPQDRTWNFVLEDYHVFMKKLQCLKGAVSISGLPDYVLKVRAFFNSTCFG
jgi:hypothetical protein